jgi:hypothetical protein
LLGEQGSGSAKQYQQKRSYHLPIISDLAIDDWNCRATFPHNNRQIVKSLNR